MTVAEPSAEPVAAAPQARPTALRFLLFGKLLVSALLLYWVLSRAGLREVLAAARGASVPLLVFAYSLNFVGLLLSATRWRTLLRAQGVDAPLSFLFRSCMVAGFFNNVLPSTVGGDVSRAYDSYRVAGGNMSAMASVVVDRLLGLLVLVLFAMLSIPLATRDLAGVRGLAFWILLVGAATIALVGALFFGRSDPSFGLVSRLPKRLAGTVTRVLAAFGMYRGKPRVLAVAFGLSFLLQTNVILYFVVIAASLGLAVPILAFFYIVPLASAVMLIPVTVNGIGLRENVLALLLAVYGVTSPEAVAYAWLVYLGGLIQGVLGGVVYGVSK